MKSRKPSRPALASDSLALALLKAAEVVADVLAGLNLDASLASCWQAGDFTSGQRGAVQDLAYGTLRQYGRGDFFLARLLRSPLDLSQKDNPALLLRSLLLAALYRLETHPESAHTTVDQAVSASAWVAHGQFRALTNAVLRNRLRRDAELLAAAAIDSVACHQHPGWWIDRIRAAYPDDWQDVLASGNARPPMTLRANRRKITGSAYLALLHAAGIGARLLRQDGQAILLDHPQRVGNLPGFGEGLATVQDLGAQHAALLLDVQPGMHVLDACAAPGGKTTHLLELSDINLLSLDMKPERVERIRENLDRLGLQAEFKVADCRKPQQWWDKCPFERILADVPCSASGVVRRHPDSKWLRRENDIAGFVSKQAEILEALWHVLAPGGKMLYCTCSLFPEENQLQIVDFIANHDDAECLPLAGIQGSASGWQLLPQAEQDGFFYALLQKSS
ncbi:MAG: 16S rRNA (cytosine(967)-C(5))-methyltransferase RsmB [Sterolibacterium sp.]